MTRTFFLRAFLLACVALLAGCAAQWQGGETPGGEPALPSLALQKIGSEPPSGVVPADVSALHAGDILFSAQNGFVSAGIRLLSYSSVSHAFIYLGETRAAEAVGHGGVQIISIEQALSENNLLVAYRRPGLTAADVAGLAAYAEQFAGHSYNYWAIAQQVPYMLTRKLCELPVIPRAVRYLCMNSLALVQIGLREDERFFCSEFVVRAFNSIGKPLTNVPPRWVSPSDLLHLREGDVPAVPAEIPLQYVGHLRCTPSPWNLRCTPGAAKETPVGR